MQACSLFLHPSTLLEKPLDTNTFITKRTVYLACLGIDIYMLTLYAIQMSMTIGEIYVEGIIPEIANYISLLDGFIMIASVLSGLILLWLYVHELHDGKFLFDGRTLKAAITEKHRKFGLGKLLCFALLMFALQIVSVIFLNCMEFVLNLVGFTISESPALNADYAESIPTVLYVILIGPIAEELVFRGFLLKALSKCGRVYAIVISALMFSLMHGDIQQILFTFIAGIGFGYVAAEYSIFASLILHIINNGVYGELLPYLAEHTSETFYVFATFALMVVSIITGIVMLVKNKGKLKAYKEKHPTAAGAYSALKNRWFVAYAACMIAVTCSTVARL